MIIRASNSSLKTEVTCATKFTLEYVQGYTSDRERAESRAGTDIHRALAMYFRGYSVKRCMQNFNESYEYWTLDPQNWIEERMSYDNVAANLKTWFDRHPWAKLPFDPDPEYVENTVEEALDDNGEIRFIAVLDLLPKARGEDGYVICDHKSTKAITEWFERKFINDAQITGYVWAAQRFLKDDTINRAYINAIALKKLNMSYTKCPTHKQMRATCWPEHVEMRMLGPYERPYEQIQDWRINALRIARRFEMYFEEYGGESLTQAKMNRLAIQGAFSGACRFCHFSSWCASGRPVHTLDRMFTKRERPTGFGHTGITMWEDDEQ